MGWTGFRCRSGRTRRHDQIGQLSDSVILEELNRLALFQEELGGMETWEACARRGLTPGNEVG